MESSEHMFKAFLRGLWEVFGWLLEYFWRKGTLYATIEKHVKSYQTYSIPSWYAQTLMLANFILVTRSSLVVITFQGGGVTTCKIDRIIPLDLLYLPTPAETRNERAGP